jgi:hypothetical protein
MPYPEAEPRHDDTNLPENGALRKADEESAEEVAP